MFKNILVNGDSCCHERHFGIDESYIEKTWAYKIGAVNLAISGSSNDRIFYSTIEYLNHHTVDVLIIGWTNFDRFYLSHSEGFYLNINPGMAGDDFLLGFKKEDKGKVYKEYYNFWYQHCFNEYLNLKRFCHFYLHLQSYCELRNIRFLNFMTMWPIPKGDQLVKISKSAYMSRETKDIEQQGIKFNKKNIEEMYEKFKTEHWVDNNVGVVMTEVLKGFPTMSENDFHPGLEASDFWANKIKENLY